jgi:CRP-like cAMP-binding protein
MIQPETSWLDQSLRAALTESPSEGAAFELYSFLNTAANIAHYKPKARPDVVVELVKGEVGEAYILKDWQEQLYLEIAPEDYFVWKQMDGTRTVLDLVVAYCMEYKVLAQARIATLVRAFTFYGLLTDEYYNVYDKIEERLARRRVKYWTDKVLHTFMLRQFPIRGIDKVFDVIYKTVGWIFYLPLVLVMMSLIALSGGIAYGYLALSGDHSVLGNTESVAAGLASLAVLQIISIFLHECGHAFTVKHYGREVRRAGILFYLGIIGAFVDTTDMWLEGKWKRIAVTFAGPFVNMVLGGAAALYVWAYPESSSAGLLFQFAVTQYLLVFFNATPFIKFDGYYILTDLLGIKNLQERARNFLRNAFWYSILKAFNEGRWLPTWKREEKMLVAYGVLSTLWTLNIFGTALLLAPVRFVRILDRLLSGGNLGQLILPLGILFSLMLGFFPRIISTLQGQLVRLNDFARRQPAWQVAPLLVGLSLLLIVIPSYAGRDAPTVEELYARVLTTAASILATGFAFYQMRRYQQTRWFTLFVGIFLSSLLFALADMLEFTELIQPESLAWLQALAMLPTILGAFPTLRWWLMSFSAELRWVWVLMLAGMVALLVAVGLPVDRHASFADQVGQYFWLSGLFLHWHLTRRGLPHVTRPEPPKSILTGDIQRQTRYALKSLAEPVIRQLATLQGQKTLLVLAMAFNRHSAAHMWRVWLTMEGEVGGNPKGEWEEVSVNWKAAIDDLFNRVAQEVGTELVRSAIYDAFAELPRPIQPAALGLLSGTMWVEGLDALIDAGCDHVYLERGFRSIGESLMASCTYVYGWQIGEQVIADFNRRSALHGWEIWLRAQGKFDGRSRSSERNLPLEIRRYRNALASLLDLLRPIMGAEALHRNLTRAHDHLAWMQREVCTSLLPETWLDVQRTSDDERLILLRGVAALASLSRDDLATLAHRMNFATYDEGQVITSQGEIINQIYFIASGRAQTSRQGATGIVHSQNVLTEGAVFGLEAVMEQQPLAETLQAITPLNVWTLDRPSLIVSSELSRDTKPVINWRLLRQVTLFRDMPLDQMEQVASTFEVRTVPAGSVFITQGHMPDGLYIIQSGQVEVLVTDRVIAILGPGEVFGEQSLITGNTASATVRAKSQTQVLRLDRADFEVLLQVDQTTMQHLEQVGSRRRLTTREPLTVQS